MSIIYVTFKRIWVFPIRRTGSSPTIWMNNNFFDSAGKPEQAVIYRLTAKSKLFLHGY